MGISKAFAFLTLAACVLADGEKYFDPCNKDDIECLGTATRRFLEVSKNGISGTDIDAIDPFFLASVDVSVDGIPGVIYHFKNINVTGLKNQKVKEYKMDTTKKTVVLKTAVDLIIAADITVEFPKNSKTFTGSYVAITSALGTSQYGYQVTTNPKDGLEYFDVGEGTNSCEIVGEPNVTIGIDLQEALSKDADAQALKSEYEAHKGELRKKALCKIIEAGYGRVMKNLRASAKILPKAAFFKDI